MDIFPMSYCIPDEKIVCSVPEKSSIMADFIPGRADNYRFSHLQEAEYNEMYQQARFATTFKKGGWDCLRHYEIMANGCIPMFEDLDKCPHDTMTSFPKDLILRANRRLLPWKDEYVEEYNETVKEMLQHTRKHCSTSAAAQYLLSKMKVSQIRNTLLITCQSGVNYSREFLWIGVKRHLQSIGGVAVESPKIKYLYDNYKIKNKKKLVGNGFTYSRNLTKDYQFTKWGIIRKIKQRYWDIIIFASVGPDEAGGDTVTDLPIWQHVAANYGKNEIAFIFGGDACQDLTTSNKYRDNLLYHSQFAQCFVRELKT